MTGRRAPIRDPPVPAARKRKAAARRQRHGSGRTGRTKARSARIPRSGPVAAAQHELLAGRVVQFSCDWVASAQLTFDVVLRMSEVTEIDTVRLSTKR